MINFSMNYIVNPIWLTISASGGVLTKVARETCYHFVTEETSWWHPLDKLQKEMEATTLCENVANQIFNNYTTIFSTTIWGILTTIRLVDAIKEKQYLIYKNKTHEQVQVLNSTQVESFKIGAKAYEDRSERMLSFLSYEAWRAPKAYWAGFAAKNHNDITLIEEIKAKAI